MGAGGGDNVTVSAPIAITPANGLVNIAPTGTGSLTINPATAGTMNNMAIGGTTAAAGSFTNLSVTGTTSFDGSEGTAGQVLTSAGTGNTPTWATVSGSISVTGGDLTLSGNTGTAITNATLATVNSNTGSFGSSSSIPVITVNGKGLITAVSTSAVAGGQYFGSAASKAIAYNEDSIAENITTTSGKNCLSVGPITISSGFSVTIASGQRWVIL
jgi:hypothetical protein